MNRRLLTITIHVAAWICFFVLPIVFFPRPANSNFQLSEAMIQRIVSLDAFLVAFYYLNSFVLIPRLLTRRKWLWYILGIVAAFVLYNLIPKIFENAILAEMPEKARNHFLRRNRSQLYPFTGSNAVFFLVFTVSTCIRVVQEWLGIEEKTREIENEKMATELSFLKSQINPHFFFNTLNNIYSLAVVKSDDTASAVLKLSAIMRYVLNETRNNAVDLEKEIHFIQNYIELQKVRLTDKVTISFETSGEIAGMQIAPLILMPFVENAFKYGVSTKENSTLTFKLHADKKQLFFSSVNDIVPGKENSDENSGIGLKNTKRRLELLYPHKHTLQVIRQNSRFIVNLTLEK